MTSSILWREIIAPEQVYRKWEGAEYSRPEILRSQYCCITPSNLHQNLVAIIPYCLNSLGKKLMYYFIQFILLRDDFLSIH